jgi:ATP-binding cassette subfamily B protein
MQKNIISLFWTTAMRYPLRTWVAMINICFTIIIAGFAGPYIISLLLQQLQNGNLTIDSAYPLIIVYTFIQIYGQIIGGRINLFLAWTMESAAMRDLYQKIFDALTAQSLTFHANKFGGALVSQTTKLIGSFERFWDTIFWQLLPSIASIVAGVVILSFIFWQYAVILAAISIAFIFVVYYGSRFMSKINREEAQAMTAANAYIADSVTNISTIKSHGSEGFEQTHLNAKAAFYRGKSLASMNAFLKVSTAYSSLITLMYVVALIIAVWASQQHLISIATVYLAVTYTFTVGRQLWEMNSIMRNYNRILGDAHDMAEILSLQPSVTDASKQVLKVHEGAVSMNDIQFTHDGSKRPLFKDFSLSIAPGEHIGLIGHSGSGKTTITRLLLRFSDIEKGTIVLDDQNIANVTQKSLRESIAYVSQEPMLFHRTLHENISYAKPDATMKEIRLAAKQANALEFIDNLELGMDTLVGERGVKLSGGQRQRVAIARAILKDAPILVLDEATSALDSESEKLIQDALAKLMKGRTSIVIAHRLSTIAKLNRIVVLDHGKIVEQGTHNDLLAQKGTYAKLWAHQSGGFIEE